MMMVMHVYFQIVIHNVFPVSMLLLISVVEFTIAI